VKTNQRGRVCHRSASAGERFSPWPRAEKLFPARAPEVIGARGVEGGGGGGGGG